MSNKQGRKEERKQGSKERLTERASKGSSSSSSYSHTTMINELSRVVKGNKWERIIIGGVPETINHPFASEAEG
jgi:hypothetical protein